MYWHKRLYRIDIDQTEFYSKLEKLISIQESNSLNNHIFRSHDFYDEVVRGEIENGSFTIWRTNSSWNGIFYPIFKGILLEVQGNNLLELKTRFNPVAEIIVSVLGTVFLFLLAKGSIFNSNIDVSTRFFNSTMGILLFFILQSVPIVSYYNLKNQTLRELEKYFELTMVRFKRRKV